MKTDVLDYPLPARLIAQTPAARRDQSRLLVVHRQTRVIGHHVFTDLPGFLRPGDILFRNNAAVLPARLIARRPTGGKVECLLLRPSPSLRPTGRPARTDWSAGDSARDASQCAAGTPRLQGKLDRIPAVADDLSSDLSAIASAKAEALAKDEWWCLLRPGKKLPLGARFGVAGQFDAEVKEKTPDGLARIAFETTGGDILAVANRLGEMPLPPYIHRWRTAEEQRLDRERYQTVYADRARQVAVAAPTAGLHFTPELLDRIAAGGVRLADITLHVGLDTFRPIITETVEEHAIHREGYEVPPAAQQALANPTGRRIAVGTTTVRAIEDFIAAHPDSERWSVLLYSRMTSRRSERVGDNALHHDLSHRAEAAIFIRPPFTFGGVDALLTNFHQPRSTLLCLVAAFLTPGSADGIAWIKEIYAEAAAREYRFFSYGDAMLIL